MNDEEKVDHLEKFHHSPPTLFFKNAHSTIFRRFIFFIVVKPEYLFLLSTVILFSRNLCLFRVIRRSYTIYILVLTSLKGEISIKSKIGLTFFFFYEFFFDGLCECVAEEFLKKIFFFFFFLFRNLDVSISC